MSVRTCNQVDQLYPGQYFDTETGLHQNYFRDYDPQTGRYIQADPIGLAGGMNLYGYVSANPMSAIDPFGLYESHWLLRAIVPGQVFYDYGRTAIENRQFGLATIYFGSMLAEQGFFAWSFGGTQVIRALATLGERQAVRAAEQSVARCALEEVGKGIAGKNALQIAEEGGRHAGFLKNYAGRTPAEFRKGVISIEKEIANHQMKIANPGQALPNWSALDPRQQQWLLNKKWPSDIQRLSEQADILRGLLGGGP